MIGSAAVPPAELPRQKGWLSLDAAVFILPLLATAFGAGWLALWSVNLLVLCFVLRAIWSGIAAFRRWQGRWPNEMCFTLVTTSLGVMGAQLAMMLHWWVIPGWDIHGPWFHFIWAYIYYFEFRLLHRFHFLVKGDRIAWKR